MKKSYERAAEALDKKLAKYLANEGITSLDLNVSEKQLEKLFLVFTKDFLEYQIFFDDYSTLCEKLLVALRDTKNRINSDLYTIFHYGAELSWYIRNEPVRGAHFLEILLNYYKENVSTLSANEGA